jgi:DNA-binding GntR family transcriptional regulator
MTVNPPAPQSQSGRAYDELRSNILRGEFGPREPLKPQDLADELGVSLAVVREALLRLVGEGLADRRPNRGFAVPDVGDHRWQEIAEARATLEPEVLRLAIDRGDLTWESGLRAAHHTLSRTPMRDGPGPQISEAWTHAHHQFHRALLEGCGNAVLLDTYERLWNLSELARRWSASATPGRDYLGEHAAMEEAALDRDADRAAAALRAHVLRTAAVLGGPDRREDEADAGDR